MQDFPWNKEFIELTRKHYGAGLVEVDFAKSEAARKRINDWVVKETRDKIKDLIGPGVITALTRMVLANAIYFKGNWQYAVRQEGHARRPVHSSRQLEGRMCRSCTRPASSATPANTSAAAAAVRFSSSNCRIPGRELSMLVLLPEERLTAERLALYLADGNFSQTKLKTQTVKVWLPRFKAESKFLLNAPLKDLGMVRAFGDADFTGMSHSGKDLFISHVLHKAFVEVNEEGTEAAAATAVVVSRDSANVNPVPVFRADRPFVYVIRDNKTGTALFMGRYSGPAR